MPWLGNDFVYTKRLLRIIAENYISLYDGLPTRYGEAITNPWALAEYKADFDMALQSIGKGLWNGNINGKEFRDFRHYGRLQQIIIADILGTPSNLLGGLGFYDISRLRGYSYYLMTVFLNGGANERTKNNTRRQRSSY